MAGPGHVMLHRLQEGGNWHIAVIRKQQTATGTGKRTQAEVVVHRENDQTGMLGADLVAIERTRELSGKTKHRESK